MLDGINLQGHKRLIESAVEVYMDQNFEQIVSSTFFYQVTLDGSEFQAEICVEPNTGGGRSWRIVTVTRHRDYWEVL